MDIIVEVAQPKQQAFATGICELIAESAKARGTGIAKRQPDYVAQKIAAGNAVIATVDGELAGFCYIETWDHARYVVNSGLIVAPQFRRLGLARRIKSRIFQLSREKYPEAKIFGITTSLAVMRINSSLGYEPVTFSELTQDDAFWQGCASCPNYDILQRNERKLCLCTGMLAPNAEVAAKMKVDISDQVLKNSLGK
ncbi:MAG: GNAT family N-acetyltransferase [Bacteroidota bacterium]